MGGAGSEVDLAAVGGVAVAVAEARVAGRDSAGTSRAACGPVGNGADAAAGAAVVGVGEDDRAATAAGDLTRRGTRRTDVGVGGRIDEHLANDVRPRAVVLNDIAHVGGDIPPAVSDIAVRRGDDVAVLPRLELGDIGARRLVARVHDVVAVHLVG